MDDADVVVQVLDSLEQLPGESIDGEGVVLVVEVDDLDVLLQGVVAQLHR